jgi:hypothetical protein
MPYADPAQRAAAKRRYYERNAELCKQRARDSKAADPERERQRLRDWHAANHDASRAQVRDWKRNNREKVAAEKLAYRLANPGQWAAYCAKRRAIKRNATPPWADLGAIAEIYARAASLGFEVDHVVPLTHDLVCGLHTVANLAIIPKLDNRSKGNRYWPDMP